MHTLEKYPYMGYNLDVKEVRVKLSRKARKALKTLPDYIVMKLQAWVELVTKSGLQEARTISGFHDEMLFGRWLGFRSIRLSRAYRALYRVEKSTDLVLVEIMEVNKHEY